MKVTNLVFVLVIIISFICGLLIGQDIEIDRELKQANKMIDKNIKEANDNLKLYNK